ncbi:unnamed protein product [Ambrosiozyma monospora]|uniref:Unnamed protein product n=1 Tax=Ambrosiozyma monospora TaxID=43982 RepID=A0ACB5T625_AMBMO|nr:unnamed protein product [Ambrosiozyma monospora]
MSQLTPYSLLINKIFKLHKKGTGFKFTFNQFVPFWLLYGQLFLRDERFKNTTTEYYLLCCKSAQNKRKIARLRATKNKKKATNSADSSETADASTTSRRSSTNDSNYYGQQLAVPHSPSPPPEPVSQLRNNTDTSFSVEIPAINSGCTSRYTLVFNFEESVIYLLKTDDSTHSHSLEFMNDHKVARGFKTQIEMDGNNVAASKLLDKFMHIEPVDSNKVSKSFSSSSKESTSSKTNKTIGLNAAARAAMSRAVNIVATQIGPRVSKATLENIVSANKEPQQLLPTSLANGLELSQVHKQSRVRDEAPHSRSDDSQSPQQQLQDVRNNVARTQSLTRYKRLLLPFHMTAGLSHSLDEKTRKLVDLAAASDGTITGGFSKNELKSGVSLGATVGLNSLDLRCFQTPES